MKKKKKKRTTNQLLPGQEKIADSSGEVEQRASVEDRHLLAHCAQEPEVIVHCHKCQGMQEPECVDFLVCG